LGTPGWAWAYVEPVFRRLPLRIEPQISPNPISLAFLDALQDEGIPLERRLSGPRGKECGLFRTTMHQGRRWSASRAYLQGNMPPGLTLRLDTLVRRVVVEEGRATGVEVVTEGEVSTLQARGAVILAGGAINSPQLLLLSGIGPGEELREMGIPVRSDVPGVGRNLQDHLSVGISWKATRKVTLDGADTFLNLLRWLLFRRGPLTSPVAEAAAFLPDDGSPDPRPMLELILGPVWFANHGFDRRPGSHYTMGAVLLHPESRGRITLASPDPLAAPHIDPACLTAACDAERLLAGLRRIRHIGAHKSFAPWRGNEVFPGPGATTDEDLLNHLRAHAQSLYHPVGSCRMGPASDPMAVVDPELRVR
ncbi:MAG: choline dehydrogenase, partial [Methanomicrobiales archaeon HGW-Methanomicrobiales-5]